MRKLHSNKLTLNFAHRQIDAFVTDEQLPVFHAKFLTKISARVALPFLNISEMAIFWSATKLDFFRTMHPPNLLDISYLLHLCRFDRLLPLDYKCWLDYFIYQFHG